MTPKQRTLLEGLRLKVAEAMDSMGAGEGVFAKLSSLVPWLYITSTHLQMLGEQRYMYNIIDIRANNKNAGRTMQFLSLECLNPGSGWKIPAIWHGAAHIPVVPPPET